MISSRVSDDSQITSGTRVSLSDCTEILEIKVGQIAWILNSEAIVVTGSGSCTLSVPTIVWIVGFTILK